MSEVKPRMAVAYHFWTGIDSTPGVLERIRTTYDGPLSLAKDFMVWNVSKDEIRTRMAVVEEATWSPPVASEAIPPSQSDRDALSKELNWEVGYSPFISNGKWDGVDDDLRQIYKEAGEALGREFKYPEKK